MNNADRCQKVTGSRQDCQATSDTCLVVRPWERLRHLVAVNIDTEPLQSSLGKLTLEARLARVLLLLVVADLGTEYGGTFAQAG